MLQLYKVVVRANKRRMIIKSTLANHPTGGGKEADAYISKLALTACTKATGWDQVQLRKRRCHGCWSQCAYTCVGLFTPRGVTCKGALDNQSVRAVSRRYPQCALTERLLDFFAHNSQWDSFEEHPKYILLVLSSTSHSFTCICRSSVMTSIHIALPLLALHITVLSWRVVSTFINIQTHAWCVSHNSVLSHLLSQF
jgi:hypothetical protein